MFPFIAQEYQEVEFELLPDGLYKFKIINPHLISNKEQTAKGIGITYVVTSGLHMGKIIFDKFYIDHPTDIFKKGQINKLNGLMAAIKKTQINNVMELETYLFTGRVKKLDKSADGKWPAKNIITKYYPYEYNEGDENRPDEQKDEDIPF